jgi:hypothetical protein
VQQRHEYVRVRRRDGHAAGTAYLFVVPQSIYHVPQQDYAWSSTESKFGSICKLSLQYQGVRTLDVAAVSHVRPSDQFVIDIRGKREGGERREGRKERVEGGVRDAEWVGQGASPVGASNGPSIHSMKQYMFDRNGWNGH